MPALFFPTPDALRLVLASGIVPPEIAGASARLGFDAHGQLWLQPTALPSRDTLAALGRFGVRVLRAGDASTETVRTWAEALPLRRADVGPGRTDRDPFAGVVLFELPDTALARFAGTLRRLTSSPLGIRLSTDEGGGRAWVTCQSPASVVLLRCGEPDSAIESFIEQHPGVWCRAGWTHPLPDHLVVPPGQVLLLRPPRATTVRPGPVPAPAVDGYPLRPVRGVATPTSAAPAVPVRFTLRPVDSHPRETLWVFAGPSARRFWEIASGADERLVRQLEVAGTPGGGDGGVVVRPVSGKRVPPPPLISVDGYYADPRVPGLFVPARKALRPTVRAKELTRLFGLGPDRVTWVDAAASGEISYAAVPVTAFRPLSELVEYTHPLPHRLDAEPLRPLPFALERFADSCATEDRVSTPDPGRPAIDAADESEEAPPAGAIDDRPGWLLRSMEKILGRIRRERLPRSPADADPDAAPTGEPPRQPAARTPSPARVERKLSSADALLHGHDRAARRHELEAHLLSVFPKLGPAQRAAGWAELAGVYGATGNPTDSAVCWINAVWEAEPPPPAWLEQWFVAECRAARQPAPGPGLDRWLGEPGRSGAGRVVAAYTAWAAHQTPPPADVVAALPRVLAFLDQHMDDLPARAAWLARLAVTRLCDGDALGLARWRDRVLGRLRDRGPGLDLDEPSFLRFHGTASPDRFQTAREWLARARKPILQWVDRLRPGGRLQWAGLDAEADCTSAYAQLMLAWGLGCLGESTRSRDWAARACKLLAGAGGVGVDPAVHALLTDLFQHRIRDAQEARPARPGLPADLLARFDQLPTFSRYAVDRLRGHSRILEPVARAQAFRGLDLRGFRGYDLLGERLHVLADRTDPATLGDEARQLLSVCEFEPSSATVPRIALTLLDLAPFLDGPLVGPLLAQAVPAVSWLEAWLQAGRWTDAERADRLPDYLAQLLGGAFSTAAWFNQWPAVRPLVDHLVRRAGADAALRSAVGRVAGTLFRSLRKLGYRSEGEALLAVLDPGRGDRPADAPFPAARLGLAVGWFAVGDEDAGNRILDDARNRLFVARVGDDRARTELAIGYAEALGFAPPRIALGRLEEIFQLLDRVTVTGSTNRYYTLKPLQLVDAVVRSVVTEDFALGPAVRGWLDDDEFLIRRRIHRDMAAVLRDEGIG